MDDRYSIQKNTTVRYVKHFEGINQFKKYYNYNFEKLLRIIADRYETYIFYEKENELESQKIYKYKEVYDIILEHISKEFGCKNVSYKQLRKILNPRRRMVSKYAPIILMAIFNLVVEKDVQASHTDICTYKNMGHQNGTNAAEMHYDEFALNELLDIVYQCIRDNPNDACADFFMHYLGILRNKLHNTMGEEFQNGAHNKTFTEEELI